MWGIDEEARADVVGTASARLLAAGVARADRLGALRLLGVLTANADEHGIVRRPLDDLAGEFDLPADRASDWLAALVSVGIVFRGIGVLVLAGLEPPATNGIRLADFLAAADEVAEPEPAPAPAPRRRRLLPPVPALATAAVVAVVLAIVPLLDVGRDDRTTVPVRAERPEVTRDAADTTVVERPAASTDTDAPLPVVVPSTTSTTVAGCPIGQPLVDVIGIAGGAADGLASVEGTARNAAESDLTLEAFTVVVEAAGELVEVPGLERPLVVPAGETVRWATKTPAAALPGATATVEVDEWHWADASVQRSCG